MVSFSNNLSTFAPNFDPYWVDRSRNRRRHLYNINQLKLSEKRLFRQTKCPLKGDNKIYVRINKERSAVAGLQLGRV